MKKSNSSHITIADKGGRKKKLEFVADQLYRDGLIAYPGKSHALDWLLGEFIKENGSNGKGNQMHE